MGSSISQNVASTGTRRRLLRDGLAVSAALGGAVAFAQTSRAATQAEATPIGGAASRWIAVRSYLIAPTTSFDEIAAIADTGFLPIISAAPGFVAHYIMDIGNGGLLAVSIWETAEAADNSAIIAADFVAANLADKFQGPPDASLGSAPVYREACGMSVQATPVAS